MTDPPRRLGSRLAGDDLTTLFLLVPGLFPRNRMFAVNEDPAVRRAKRRAAILRGVQSEVERLLNGGANSLKAQVTEDAVTILYERKELDYRRVTTLSRAEANALGIMLERRGFKVPWPFDPTVLSSLASRVRRESGIDLGGDGHEGRFT